MKVWQSGWRRTLLVALLLSPTVTRVCQSRNFPVGITICNSKKFTSAVQLVLSHIHIKSCKFDQRYMYTNRPYISHKKAVLLCESWWMNYRLVYVYTLITHLNAISTLLASWTPCRDGTFKESRRPDDAFRLLYVRTCSWTEDVYGRLERVAWAAWFYIKKCRYGR